jgi:hypothetical protein
VTKQTYPDGAPLLALIHFHRAGFGAAKKVDIRNLVARMPVNALPTLAIAVLIYAGGFALIAVHAQGPLPVLIGLGGWLVAWQGSL